MDKLRYEDSRVKMCLLKPKMNFWTTDITLSNEENKTKKIFWILNILYPRPLCRLVYIKVSKPQGHGGLHISYYFII